MIRPTMSHAIDKNQLIELMNEYIDYLEQELDKAIEVMEQSGVDYGEFEWYTKPRNAL